MTTTAHWTFVTLQLLAAAAMRPGTVRSGLIAA